MDWKGKPYVILLVLATFVMTFLALYVLRHRGDTARGKAAAITLFSGSVWMLCYAMEIFVVDLRAKLLWNKLEYLGIVTMPTAWLIYSIYYAGHGEWLTRRRFILFGIIPFMTMVLVFTNDFHGLIWSCVVHVTQDACPALDHAFGFWLQGYILYAYLLLFISFIILFRMFLKQKRLYRSQIAVIVLAAVVILLANFVRQFGLVDMEPFAIALICLPVAWALFRLRLGDIVPVAYDFIIEGMHDPVIVLDTKNRILELNVAARDLCARPDSELIGQHVKDLWHGWIDENDLKGSGEEMVTELVLEKEGVHRTYEMRISPLFDARKVMISRVVMLRDISENKKAERLLRTAQQQLEERVEQRTAELTQANRQLIQEIEERKFAEAALRESEKKYRTVLESIEDGFFEVDLGGNFTFFNEAACQMVGYSRTELMGMNNREYMDRKNAKKVLHVFNRVYKTFQPQNAFDWEVITKEGSKIHVDASVSLIVNSENEPIGFRGIVRDVTERKRAEEALRESEERYRTVLEVNPDPVVVYDTEDRVIYFNQAFERVFGWTLEERLGKKMEMFAPEDELAETKKMIESVKQGKGFSDFETRRYTKNGDIIDISMSAAIWRDSSGVSVGRVITLRDITEQKKLEARLRHAHKLESIGIMASGVAHNFRNILNTVAVNSQLIRLKYSGNHSLLRMSEGIDKAIERGAQLVDGLVQFSRKGITGTLRLVNLSSAVRETCSLINKSFDKKIEIQTDISDSIPVMGDHSSLRQVIMNLCTNARDAMPDGGILTIKARQKGARAEIMVSDTGHGMDKKTLDKCFDPFFTTKAVDKGTGLGLSTSYGIIKEHKGDIHAYSELGKGTIFKIYLPLELDARPREEKTTTELMKGEGQKILIVDDDISMLEPLENLLEGLGYEADSESSGASAIEKYGSWRPDVVLMDRNMPKMDGISCLNKIFEKDPTAKFILVSGYDDEGANGIDDQTREIICGYITKPIDMSELSQMLFQLFVNYK